MIASDKTHCNINCLWGGDQGQGWIARILIAAVGKVRFNEGRNDFLRPSLPLILLLLEARQMCVWKVDRTIGLIEEVAEKRFIGDEGIVIWRISTARGMQVTLILGKRVSR